MIDAQEIHMNASILHVMLLFCHKEWKNSWPLAIYVEIMLVFSDLSYSC